MEQLTGLELIGYEPLAAHGFALPCFSGSALSNAVYVARAAHPGDASATIADFDLYEPQLLERLDAEHEVRRRVTIGSPWLDVFLWEGSVYVGTKAEIWKNTSHVRKHIAAYAPLSLLNLAEGFSGRTAVQLANAAFSWMNAHYGATEASEWQIQVYLRGQAIRGLRRRLGASAYTGRARLGLRGVTLEVEGKTLRIRIPTVLSEIVKFMATDLYGVCKAASEFGFQPKIVREGTVEAELDEQRGDGMKLLMRLRQGRGRTQTQIPFRALDEFFGDDVLVREKHNGAIREMTLSRAAGRRNTMKLHLRELIDMEDPMAIFERGPGGISYEVHDVRSPEGKRIEGLLKAGLEDRTTSQTQGGATLWKIV